MERWSGKNAVVTGASAGLGAAIAKKLVEEGINVFGFARRKEKIEQLSREISGKNGAKLYPIKADVSNENEIITAFGNILENHGPVSILVNNAGIVRNTTLLDDGNTESWRKILETNVLGLCITTREAVNLMKKHDIEGHVIHINSIAGHIVTPLPFNNVYSASKHAVTALAKTLKNELRAAGNHKIKVTSLSPGYVETEIVRAGGFGSNEIIMELEAKAPRMYPEDIANAVAYVLSTPLHVEVRELTIQPTGEPF